MTDEEVSKHFILYTGYVTWGNCRRQDAKQISKTPVENRQENKNIRVESSRTDETD